MEQRESPRTIQHARGCDPRIPGESVNRQVRELLESILDEPAVAQALKVAPAAMKLHHAYRGGLMEHTLSLCAPAELLLARYPRAQPGLAGRRGSAA